MRSWAQQMIAVPLLALALLAGSASDYSLFRCRHDGVARKACCCGDTKAETPASSVRAERLSCCDVTHVTVARAPSELLRVAHDVAPVVLAALPGEPRWAVPPRAALAVVPIPSLGPPIILKTRSLLI